MCGILGLICNNNYHLSNEQFININKLNFNRGPDDFGVFFHNFANNQLKLGHTRLSILDLSKNANQPMHSISGRFTISFNGEIYNHLFLREKIENRTPVRWRTNCDTETLLNFFEFFSIDDVFNSLEGMFSFILFDKKKNKLLVARDLAGEKPLYFSINEKFIYFSSDLKTLTKIPNFDRKINNDALQFFLEKNYIPNPHSIYDNVFKLPPASYLTINFEKFKWNKLMNFEEINSIEGVHLKKWWNINFRNNKEKNEFNFTDKQNIIHESLRYSVKQQLISDVPLGAFLSGGIDSSLIVSLMREYSNKVNTFSIGYEDEEYDESKYANKIANRLETNHNSYIFTKSEIINFIKNTSNVFSEPFADSSQIPTQLVSKIAKQQVKVVLTGDGGDELFGGYNRYLYANKFWKYFKYFNPSIKNVLLQIVFSQNNNLIKYSFKKIFNIELNNNSLEKIKIKLLKINNQKDYYSSLTNEWTAENKILSKNFNKYTNYEVDEIFNNKNLLFEEKMMLSDFITYLTDDILCKVDRSTMNFSLESRAPFLSRNLVEKSQKLPLRFKFKNGQTKYILREILKQYIPNNLIDRPKKGFGVPIGNLFGNDLKEWTFDILSYENCKKHNLFNYKKIKDHLNDHLIGKSNNQYKIWSLIQFNLWYENFHLK